ncbi:hypothetical protein RHGRI_024222 [Rhododendron griersonianum]|uniref:Uncharacterized protein n=1 Tax=Rhododendron griersonianum TaxID=479676 RepID=A0AAV6JA89_9ERIC|nr:hypothetical protein RHGRI_024222 [Rhododendron griersonianum]
MTTTQELVELFHKQGNGGDARGNWFAEDLNKGRLDYLAYFLMCVKWNRYKGTNANTLGVPLEKMQSDTQISQATSFRIP